MTPSTKKRAPARRPARRRRSSFEPRELTLHGHRVVYRLSGEGPLLVLVHGITSSSQTWESIGPRLAERFTVLAPDLLGHGRSAKPRGDYSLGAYASGIRDLMISLGFERGTFVGHSLGGGVAMQLAYQFPERTERLVLVSSGGLGREVSLVLRAATIPGAEVVLPLLASNRLLGAGRGVGRFLDRVRLSPKTDIAEIARGHASLADPEARAAFVHTLRAVVEPSGQRVDARDRLYLAREVPFLIMWGEEDSVIPARHGQRAHELVRGSRLEVLPDAGHFPHLDQPDRFLEVLADFVDSTEPAAVPPERWSRLLAGDPPTR
ncbi:MAG: alpha/beta fold hydrolase [Thermoleophilaceae bacterium]